MSGSKPPVIKLVNVNIYDLKSGTRYLFKHKGNQYEGTFIVHITTNNTNQYIFGNVVDITHHMFQGTYNIAVEPYPTDFYEIDFSRLPKEISSYIGEFGGGKSRKTKRRKSSKRRRGKLSSRTQ